jgi:phosphoglycolate phosphatase-like HAD superfamily hydrolase
MRLRDKTILFFDLDGTLTDPKEGITKSYRYALSAFGIQEDLDSLVKFIGLEELTGAGATVITESVEGLSCAIGLNL